MAWNGRLGTVLTSHTQTNVGHIVISETISPFCVLPSGQVFLDFPRNSVDIVDICVGIYRWAFYETGGI